MKYKNTLTIIFLLMFLSCDLNKKIDIIDIKNAIPVNSDLVIKIQDWKKMQTKVEAFEWWQELKNTKLLDKNLNLLNSLNQQYQITPLFDNRDIYLSSILDINEQSKIILITSYP